MRIIPYINFNKYVPDNVDISIYIKTQTARFSAHAEVVSKLKRIQD